MLRHEFELWLFVSGILSIDIKEFAIERCFHYVCPFFEMLYLWSLGWYASKIYNGSFFCIRLMQKSMSKLYTKCKSRIMSMNFYCHFYHNIKTIVCILQQTRCHDFSLMSRLNPCMQSLIQNHSLCYPHKCYMTRSWYNMSKW